MPGDVVQQALKALDKNNGLTRDMQRQLISVDNAGTIRQLFSDGVFDTSGTGAEWGFKVTNTAMELFVSLDGTITQGNQSEALAYGYGCVIDDSYNSRFALVSDGDATNPRDDIVWVNRTKIGVSQGTPAASPADPDIPDDALALWRVLVPAGETDGSGLVLTDLRVFAVAIFALIPYVGAVTDVDLGAHDLTVDTTTLHVASSLNSVGLGTVSPARRLHVYSPSQAVSALFESGGVGHLVDYKNSNASPTYIGFRFLNAANASKGFVGYQWGTNNLVFAVSQGSAELLSINLTSGYIGIGVTAPTSPLQVAALPTYTNNAAATAGGLTVGAFYRTGADPDPVCVVH